MHHAAVTLHVWSAPGPQPGRVLTFGADIFPESAVVAGLRPGAGPGGAGETDQLITSPTLSS